MKRVHVILVTSAGGSEHRFHTCGAKCGFDRTCQKTCVNSLDLTSRLKAFFHEKHACVANATIDLRGRCVNITRICWPLGRISVTVLEESIHGELRVSAEAKQMRTT